MKYIYILLLLSYNLVANEIAIALDVVGDVTAKNSGKIIKVTDGMALKSNMILFTKADSSVTVIFKDNSRLTLGSSAILKLKKYIFKPVKNEYNFELFLEKGSIAFESGKIGELSPEDFILKTPEGTVAIRGTKFFTQVQ